MLVILSTADGPTRTTRNYFNINLNEHYFGVFKLQYAFYTACLPACCVLRLSKAAEHMWIDAETVVVNRIMVGWIYDFEHF